MKKNIILKINNESYFKVKPENKYWCKFDDIIIFFHYKKKKYLALKYECLFSGINDLKGLLELALDNKLQLHKSINSDIGYLWNEYLQGNKDDLFFKMNDDGTKEWIGKDYLLWCPSQGENTWIFNKDNRIFLEVTPGYKWHFSDIEEAKKNEKDYITYDEFIKNYKAIAIVEIDKEVARKLLIQLDDFLKHIEENDKHDFDKET